MLLYINDIISLQFKGFVHLITAMMLFLALDIRFSPWNILLTYGKDCIRALPFKKTLLYLFDK
ncbi:MAG: hypothetical protein A2Z71_07590 [Chloroflexi bacterium RBG_13_50_21]|nr:MAG: hypothetical protein A2Z71_07590 [Chloroflexi bacterium RBG_13_50_21]